METQTQLGYTEPYRWERVRSGTKHLRLVKGVADEPGIYWVYLDTDPNEEERRAQKRSSEYVRTIVNLRQLPTVAIMAIPWLHPQYVPTMNGDNRPFHGVPGYELDIREFAPHVPTWSGVPCLHFDVGGRQMGLDANGCGDDGPDWSVPLQEECQN